MPEIDSVDLDIIRGSRHTVNRYISIAPRTALFTAQVSGTPLTDAISGGIYEIPYSSVSGDHTLCKTGMTVDVGTTAGASDLGRFRLRANLTASSGNMKINETPFAAVPVNVNHYLTVREEFSIWQKMPRLVVTKSGGSKFFNDFVEYHDYDKVYANENSLIQPIVNITQSGGIPAKPAGFVDPGQIYRTVTLSASESIPFATGAATLTYLWDVVDGTIISGSVSTADIVVTFPATALFRYIKLTVSDNLGGGAFRYFPIWVHNSSNPPLKSVSGSRNPDFKVLSDSTSEGRSMSFEFFGVEDAIAEDTLPDGALVCYWEESKFDGVAAPEQIRSHFIGWVTTDANRLDAIDSRYIINVDGPTGRLSNIGGFSNTLSDTGTTPTRWYEMEDIHADRLIHYVLREYTTALLMINFYPEVTDNTYSQQKADIRSAKIWDQIKDLASSYYGNPGFDTMGGLWLRAHPSYLDDTGTPPTERDNRDNVMQVVAHDQPRESTPEISERKYPSVGQVESVGSHWTGTGDPIVIASRWPGKTPVEPIGMNTTPFLWLPTGTEEDIQTLLNKLTGYYGAHQDRRIQDFEIQFLGNYDIFEPAWSETVQMLWDKPHIRGFGFTGDERFLIKSIDVDHSNEPGEFPKRVRISVEIITTGKPGETYILPAGDWIDDPFWDLHWENPTSYPPPDGETQGGENETPEADGVGFLFIWNTDGQLAYTTDLSSASPTYTDLDPPANGRVVAACSDGGDGAWVITVVDGDDAFDNGDFFVYHCADIFAITTTWDLEYDGTDFGVEDSTAWIPYAFKIEAQGDTICASFWSPNDDASIMADTLFFSIDGGASWDDIQPGNGDYTNVLFHGPENVCGFAIGYNERAYWYNTGGYQVYFENPIHELLDNIGAGQLAAWPTTETWYIESYMYTHIRAGADRWYVNAYFDQNRFSGSGSGIALKILRGDISGGVNSWTDITPQSESEDLAELWDTAIAPANHDHYAIIAERSDTANIIMWTEDGGSSWIDPFVNGSGLSYFRIAKASNSPPVAITTSRIDFIEEGLYSSKLGNLSSVWGGIGTLNGLFVTDAI